MTVTHVIRNRFGIKRTLSFWWVILHLLLATEDNTETTNKKVPEKLRCCHSTFVNCWWISPVLVSQLCCCCCIWMDSFLCWATNSRRTKKKQKLVYSFLQTIWRRDYWRTKPCLSWIKILYGLEYNLCYLWVTFSKMVSCFSFLRSSNIPCYVSVVSPALTHT